MSTQLMFSQASASLAAQQSGMSHIQQQMATGRRILLPSDEPVAAAAVLNTVQSIAFNQRHADNQTAAVASLNLAESTLGAFGDALQDARQQLLSANNGIYSDAERGSIATELEGLRGQLLGLANARDGAGGYLFAGFNQGAVPFTLTPAGVTYGGDDGERQVEVGPQRSIAASVNGATTFLRVPNGNGVFSAAAGAANAGTGIIDPGRVANPAALTGHQYQIAFTGASTYDVLDVTLGTTVSSGNAYQADMAISIAGMQTSISGAPAAGDRFNLDPSQNQSVFATLTNVIAALRTPTVNGAGLAAVTNQVNAALTNLDRAAESALSARTVVGTRLAEVARLQDITGAHDLEDQRRLSELQDLDYAKAASDVARQQMIIEASQQVFARTSKLTLFDYLR
jgi:flagellar hook-associated protein 3 FlgL